MIRQTPCLTIIAAIKRIKWVCVFNCRMCMNRKSVFLYADQERTSNSRPASSEETFYRLGTVQSSTVKSR